ncbi:VRR-NUC domain-containing protein [Aquirufa sp. ROCK-SH2]
MNQENPIILKPTYYWDYFNYILLYVQKHYQNLLSDSEKEFLIHFQSLSFESQCLFIRLASRRTPWFRVESLVYPEISSIDLALDELIASEFLKVFEKDEVEHLPSLLRAFNKQECLKISKQHITSIKGLNSLKKEDLVQLILEHISASLILNEIQMISPQIVQPLRLTTYSFLQFLFFGSRSRDLTDFVVRDLGHRSFVEIEEEHFVPYFNHRKEAVEKWNISVWRQWLYEMMPQENVTETIYFSWKNEILPLKDELSELASYSFEKTLFELGRYLERQNELEKALEVYQHSLQSNVIERIVRIYQKMKNWEKATYWARLGLEVSITPKEIHFFTDFLAKIDTKKSIKKVTKSLKEAEKITISIQWKSNVEAGVIDYFQNKGFYASFSENRVWKNLVGLWFWDIIFDSKDQAYHHPFQSAPSHYAKDDFLLSKKNEFLSLLSMIENKLDLMEHLIAQSKKHQMQINPLVDWTTIDFELLEKVIYALNSSAILAVVKQIWMNLSSHSKGFPDLFIQKGEEYAFIEVKSPNDHLSAIQYFWHDFFKEVGIEFKLIRVEWGSWA